MAAQNTTIIPAVVLNPDTPREGVGVLVGSLLGLLAFVLALTLSFASERFNERRLGTLAETNAIGTAWLKHGFQKSAGRQVRAYPSRKVCSVPPRIWHGEKDVTEDHEAACSG